MRGTRQFPNPSSSGIFRNYMNVSLSHRSTKVLSMGGGSIEIMKDLAGKQMGY